MRERATRVWILLVCLPAFEGCGASKTTCNQAIFYPAMIAVTNAVTKAAICDADVTATGESGTFVLSASITDGGPCEYAGPNTSGSFTVTVSKSGFQSATAAVTTGVQTCDGPKPSTEVTAIELTPS